MELLTIGHSNLDIETFIGILRQHRIEALVDVRSQPYSKHGPQFNQRTLSGHLEVAGVAYHYMGDALGGRPATRSLYGPTGAPDYDAIERGQPFQEGIVALLELGRRYRTVVMCSEGDPYACHREKLVAHSLRARGARVLHLRGDGGIVVEVQPSLL